MKNLVYLCLAMIALSSCATKLPEHFYSKSLKEANYVENHKETYTVHLDKQTTTAKIIVANNANIKVNTKNDSIAVLKHQSKRPYFIITNNNDTTTLANRNIYFKKIDNFRDIGGLPTKDGNTVKWGKIYRSDNLSKLKTSEFNKFNNLNIQTVFDLRTATEIKGKNDNLPNGVKYVHASLVEDDADVINQMRGKVLRGEISDEQSVVLMQDLYTSIISDNIPMLRQFINQVLDADAPVLYHCSAGKDRTGITTVLILSILNVDRQTIINEYLMSDYYRRQRVESILSKAKIAKIVKPHIGLKAIQNFMSVDKRYIQTAFDEIDTKYGGMDNFIRNQLGISDARRKELIKKLTY